MDLYLSTVAAEGIVCPNVAEKLPDVPAAAKAEVDRNLAQLDKQLQEANDRLATSAGEGGPNFIQNAILGPLTDKRAAAIDRISIAIGRVAERPTGLDDLAGCSLGDSTAPPQEATPTDQATPGPSDQATPSDQVTPPEQTTAPPATGSATPDPGGGQSADPAAQTIVCPNVADKLPDVPAAAKAEVDRNLAQLDKQLQEANDRLATSAGEGGPNFIQNAILGPLTDKRAAAIDRISIAIGRVAERPTGLDDLAGCSLGDAQNPAEAGLSADDFVDIRDVPKAEQPQAGENASTGTYASQCGTNREGHSNTDNLILAPGMSDGAQLRQDYVGNTSTDAFSTNESLAAADTTCRTGDDRSAYFWPTLRVRGSDDASAAGGDTNNAGTPVQPTSVKLEYRGNLTSEVTAAPRFLRMVSGDARAATNGAENARPTFTCTGFTDRLTDKYPICPSGSDLVRVFDMPSCWDGQNLDSADHRTHLVFPDETGACPSGTEAVPQLRMTLTYDDVPASGDVPYAVDGFASEQNDPSTDHAGAIGVMSQRLMNTVVRCVNSGKDC
ncbi:DUF1996 domain-containing protein [Nonomuraea angiospora]|uniref:DUF1996 domain-containing protein n=1 Tax=Nonomuraea angiospora TaxID=46172 RepID=A0ABR9MAW1_9ACTN|nr:DUF1996 domain-containing protein [Nonomuraea angiospora]MBE1590041.1 hypothetical protein [Nonomuraea angiospora]